MNDDKKPPNKVKYRFILAIGEFELSNYGDEQLWLGQLNGEGMSIWTYELERILKDYYEANF